MEVLYLVDLDGVVFDFLNPLLRCARSVWGIEVTSEHVLFPEFERFPCPVGSDIDSDDWIELFLTFEQEGCYANLPLLPGAAAVVNTLFKSKALIVFLIARDPAYDLATYEALNRAGILFDLIHFGVDDKAEFLQFSDYRGQFKRICMIDDQARRLLPCSIYLDKGYLMAWPHNRGTKLPTNIERVGGWRRILRKEGLDAKALG